MAMLLSFEDCEGFFGDCLTMRPPIFFFFNGDLSEHEMGAFDPQLFIFQSFRLLCEAVQLYRNENDEGASFW